MYVENKPTSSYSTLKRSALGKVTRKTIPHLGTVKLKTSALGTVTSKTSAQWTITPKTSALGTVISKTSGVGTVT